MIFGPFKYPSHGRVLLLLITPGGGMTFSALTPDALFVYPLLALREKGRVSPSPRATQT
jgi:hypothetical protein